MDETVSRHGVTVIITRSAGPDNAPVVFIDTTDTLDGPVGPEIRVHLNDEAIYTGKAYEPVIEDDWEPEFSPWRHGGWYVDNLRYPSGAVGCVSRNYADKKWRIVCDRRPDAHNLYTYPSRRVAAIAERQLVKEGILS